MISSTVRRVILVSPPTPILSSLSVVCPRAATVTASTLTSYRSHQRRLSSSKPSNPADGSKGVAESAAVAATPTQSRADGEKKSARGGRRKAKDVNAGQGMKGGRDEAFKNLPSVPSTQHIAPTQICASDFFSLHRPISLTMNFPKPVTDEAFAAIFTPRTKANTKPSDVISTLSNTLEMLDPSLGKAKSEAQQDQWNEQADELRAAISAKAEAKNQDNLPGNTVLDFPHNILSGMYLPFHPPPPPVPQPNKTADSLAAGAEAASEPQQRTYTAILTIEESTDANGELTFKTHGSEVYEDEPTAARTRFMERMQIRRERYRQQKAEENGMYTISVKRQRKLKMKKHKYKKLMRRTRTLRRKLERG